MDIYRPIYHFLPEGNWMNDPNGVIYYEGHYHLFYQCNPNDNHWGDIHWGHARSKDLVHWEHLPMALYPSKELGEAHCFSGSCIINEGTPTIFYTSIGTGERNPSTGAEQWMATSNDNMLTWQKYALNPVLTVELHGDTEIREWRDPFLWREGNDWYMVIGGSHNKKGCVLIYRSKDLKVWKFLNILLEGNGDVCECPNYFKLGDKYVMVYSPYGPVKYLIGSINENYKFISKYEGIIDYSGWEGFYAPNSLEDPQGRRIMWGWLTEQSRNEFNVECGWAGVQSLPRVLTISKQGKLNINPVPEIEKLRYDHVCFRDKILLNETYETGVRGRALEIEVTFKIDSVNEEFEIEVFKSSNGQETTKVIFNARREELTVDRSQSSLSQLPNRSNLCAPLPLKKGDTLKLRIFIDHSLIEVFANEEQCISTRIYPVLEDSDKVDIKANNKSKVILKKLDIWKLKSINL